MSEEQSYAPFSPAESLKGWHVIIDVSGTNYDQWESLSCLQAVAGKTSFQHLVDCVAALSPEGISCIGVDTTRDKGIDDFLHSTKSRGIEHELVRISGALKKEDGVAATLLIRGDMPLIEGETLLKLVGQHRLTDTDMTVLTVRAKGTAIGLPVSRRNGRILGISSQLNAVDPHGTQELAVGIYATNADAMIDALENSKVPSSSDFTAGMAALSYQAKDSIVDSFQISEASEVEPLRDRISLANLNAISRNKIRKQHMNNGVTFVDPNTSYIDSNVEIGFGTTVYPNVSIGSGCKIGRNCRIHSNSQITETYIGDDVEIVQSVINGSEIGNGCHVGPSSHLRPGSSLGNQVHIGTSVETKSVTIGSRTRVGHFSYLGDATVGADVNIGAGAIIANYDGTTKHVTVIGDGAFIGSGTVLVSPVSVGNHARTAAGAIVISDVGEGELVLGVPAVTKYNRPHREVPDR
ncbi:MAG: hypothetical protein VYB76_05115 [Chloroflexota bacterium]|nr:hypothetical protein [Chloroflexota bacterium]